MTRGARVQCPGRSCSPWPYSLYHVQSSPSHGGVLVSCGSSATLDMRLLTSACVDGSRLRCKLILSWHDRHSRAAGHVHLGLAAHVALGLSSLGVIFFRARSFIPRDRAPRAVVAPRVEAVLLHTVPRREEAVHAREHEARLDLLRRAALHEGLPSSPVTSSPGRICSASPSPSPPSWRRKVLAISGTVRATRQTRRSVTWPRKSWHGATKSTVLTPS